MNISYWENEMIKEVPTFFVMRNVSVFGGKLNGLAITNIIMSFIMILVGLFLSYINRMKFHDRINLEE